MENFQEIADAFRLESAMVQVASADELGREVGALMLDEPRRRDLGERARNLVGRNRGAVSRTTDALVPLLA
jgi:3-deoxy-D-manno-octulosonic-acid transferase